MTTMTGKDAAAPVEVAGRRRPPRILADTRGSRTRGRRRVTGILASLALAAGMALGLAPSAQAASCVVTAAAPLINQIDSRGKGQFFVWSRAHLSAGCTSATVELRLVEYRNGYWYAGTLASIYRGYSGSVEGPRVFFDCNRVARELLVSAYKVNNGALVRGNASRFIC